MAKKEEIGWYALRVFRNYPAVLKALDEAFVEIYRTELIPRLLFVRCTPSWLMEFKRLRNDMLMYYRDIETGMPGRVRDAEMEAFKIVTSIKDENVRFLGPDQPAYHVGERVRVTQGFYKGAEGYIKRIRKSRDLLVSIEGVAVVAISHVPPEYLEKVN